MITNKQVKIEIIKDVFWEDWGTMRKVFRKGWTGWATGHYKDGKLYGVSAESPIYRGVSDGIWDDCYKLVGD
ncbi:hypothetical protein DSO10_04605 [Listeria monocytogenes]|nr:hypothetical protein [Listeria monocytogenes]MCN73782.1 hypothetical protein [Listeria monocytogenes]TYU89008.1 hypothetical protein FZX01_05370 [Listeria monocytogenes]